jgi:multisubunit Na+/H+ antiporter MnhF subunit
MIAAATAHGETVSAAADAATGGAAAMVPMALTGFTAFAMVIAFALAGVALLLAFARLVLGPTLADRVVALDLVTMIIVVILTLFGMAVDDGAYLDAAIALGLVAFLATVAFARYIERLPRTPTGNEPESVADYRAIDNRVSGPKP